MKNEPAWMTRLKVKWNIRTNRDFWLIMIAFSLAGMAVTRLRPPVFHLLGIEEATPFWLKTLIYIPLIVPLYQICLLFFGTVLGQFGFFWEKQKKIGRFLAKAFARR